MSTKQTYSKPVASVRIRERPRHYTPLDPVSLTRPEFKNECDINVLMKRYEQNGVPEAQEAARQRYGDVSEIPDYQTALHTILAAEAHFNALPARVRERFSNDPSRLLAFVHDPQNKDEGIKLGLFNPPSATPASPSDANAAPSAAPAAKPAASPGA